jgi:hypothetical protein
MIVHLLRECRPSASKVNEVVADQNAVYAGIAFYVPWFRRSIRARVERIALVPRFIARAAEINVVSAALFPATYAIRLLRFKASIRGKLVERHGLGHAHCVNEMSASLDAASITCAANNPIGDLG